MERNHSNSGLRRRTRAWSRISLGAVLLSLPLCTHPAHGQQSGDTQADESRNRGGVPGGQMVRGVISTITGDHLSVKAEDGQSYDIVTTSNTRVMRQRQPVKLTDLKPGDGVGAAGVLDASTHALHAAVLFVVSAEDLRKAQENLGKTYITGRVTSIDDLKLTIQRPDGISQVIEVDEGTSFRRGGRGAGGGATFGGPDSGGRPGQPAAGASTPTPAQTGESITLADIKVGDNIFATGALHNNVFRPTDLRVANPRRRRTEDSATAAPASPAANSSH